MSDGVKMETLTLPDGTTYELRDSEAVRFTEQSLTDEQKLQARKNIGAVDITEVNSNVSAAVKKAAPRNLLDNSDFSNPVNQRGFVSGTEGTADYTIDRWKLQYSTLMGLEPDSISLWGHWGFWQPINRKIRDGEKYTLAVEYKGETGNERLDLKVQSVTSGLQFTHTENNIGTDWKTIAAVFTSYQDLAIGDASFDITLNSNDGQPTKTFIRWAALYEGEYTIDTLPEYQPKGYGAELAECQRYYWESETLGSAASSQWHLYVPTYILPVEMCEKYPSINVVNPWTGTEGAIAMYTSDGFVDVIADDISANSKSFSIASTGTFTKDKDYRFKVILSADIL